MSKYYKQPQGLKLPDSLSGLEHYLIELKNDLANEEKALQTLEIVAKVLHKEHGVIGSSNLFKLESELNAFQLKFPSRKIKARLEEAKNKDRILEQKAIEFVDSHLNILSRSKAFNYSFRGLQAGSTPTKADIFLCRRIKSQYQHHAAIKKRISLIKLTIPKAEAKIIRLKEEAIRQKRTKEILDRKKAQYATTVDETRNLAQSIKRRLPTNHNCPYCDGPLGENYHADHIYPVSKGGQSRESNMVNVCETCNLKKKDDTLNTFIRKYGLNRDSIERNLIKLGKEI